MEELRTLGHYEEITRRIDEMPNHTELLFHSIFARLDLDPSLRDETDDANADSLPLAEQLMGCLAASRYGRREVAALAAPDDSSGRLDALLRLVRPFLIERGELIDFRHSIADNCPRALSDQPFGPTGRSPCPSGQSFSTTWT